MEEDRRLQSIEKKLDEHGSMLKAIQQTLQLIAVQDEKIQNLHESVGTLWRKVDQVMDPKDGPVVQIQKHQASCPRGQIRALWTIIIPMGLTLIGVAIAVVTVAVK